MNSYVNPPAVAEGDKPSTAAHAYRISLTLTRRVVRRMLELWEAEITKTSAPVQRKSAVPDPASYQFSLRMLRRVVHRLIEQAGPEQRQLCYSYA